MELNKIRKKIKDNPKVYWFHIDNNNAILLSKGDSELKTKKEVNNIISENPDKYENAKIWRFLIKYHTKDTFGRVSVSINNWTEKECRLIKKATRGTVGLIWFNENYLKYNGWKNKYIKSIIRGLLIHNKKLSPVMPNSYQVDFEDY